MFVRRPRIIEFLGREMASIYFTSTYFTYCSLVWHLCKGSDRKKLERVNERGLRAIFCDWRTSYNELLTRAWMTSLYNRRLQDIAIPMYKVKFKLLPANIIDLFIASSSSYNLRNSDFFIPRFSTVRYDIHSVRYFGPLLWSKLSNKDRGVASLSTLKTNIRKKDLSSLIDDNKCTNCHLCNT